MTKSSQDIPGLIATCPFCGSVEILAQEGEQRTDGTAGKPAAVICVNCDARTLGYDLERATAAWNRRAAAPKSEGAVTGEPDALHYAQMLAGVLHSKHYSDVTNWKPLPDTLGLLTQIDNMVAPLVKPAPSNPLPAAREEVRVTEAMVDRAAQIISPNCCWPDPPNSHQAKRQQNAREKARAVLEAALRQAPAASATVTENVTVAEAKLRGYIEHAEEVGRNGNPTINAGDLAALAAENLLLRARERYAQAPAAPSQEAVRWSDVGYLMSIIDAAIEDGFDPDEDGPLLDQIRSEINNALASPQEQESGVTKP